MTTPRSRNLCASAAAAALAASLLAVPTAAPAREVRVHAFDCKAFGGRPIDLGFALQNDSSTETMSVVCPIADSSSFPKASIRTLNVHGFDNGESTGEVIPGVRAHLCTSSWFTTGGGCTGFDYAGGSPGEYALGLLPVQSSSAHRGWTQDNVADFGYLRVLLPKKGTHGRATFRGYFMSDAPPF
jgi:hypothetical protein